MGAPVDDEESNMEEAVGPRGILAESAVVLVFVVFLCLMGLGLFRVLVP